MGAFRIAMAFGRCDRPLGREGAFPAATAIPGERAAHGAVAGLNHNVFGGSPQIADPQSLIFSPAILLAWLEPNPSFRQLDLYCFLLLAAAGFAVLMFFRDRGWHPAGAVVAALATSLGGSSVWRNSAHQADRNLRLFHADAVAPGPRA